MPCARMALATWIESYIAALEILSCPVAVGVSGWLVPVRSEGNVVALHEVELPVVGSMKEMPLHHPTAASGGAHPPTFKVVVAGQLSAACTVLAHPSVKNTAALTTVELDGTTTLLI